MKYFVPDVYLETELPVQKKLEEKFGGLPWGLPANLWPRCTSCGCSQSLLAQLKHDPARLDLGRSGRVLCIFQCNHPGMCPTFDGSSGANACFVVEAEELVHGLTELPLDYPRIEREIRIMRWMERDDGISQSEVSAFFSSDRCNALGIEVRRRPSWGTKLGGVPSWIQSPDEGPGHGWRFVGQLDSGYSFYSPPRNPPDDVWEDGKHIEGRTHYCVGPNFGDGGIGYIFLRMGESRPQGWFFWQCS